MSYSMRSVQDLDEVIKSLARIARNYKTLRGAMQKERMTRLSIQDATAMSHIDFLISWSEGLPLFVTKEKARQREAQKQSAMDKKRKERARKSK